MRPPLKERLKNGDICIGTFLLFLSGGDVIQFLASLGFDYVILDMEHGSLDFARARETILAARASEVVPLVRVPEPQYGVVTRALDAGAEGIVLPRVESRRQCLELVRYGRYAPEGERGVTTFGGHNDFATVSDVPAFLAERNRNILLFVRIETGAGLANRDEILSVKGIDGCLIGTGDLAFSLGYPGQVNHPEVLDGARNVHATCKEKGLICTIPIRSPEETIRWQSTGMNMLSLSTDGGLLSAGARQFIASVHRPTESQTVSPGG